MKLLDNSTVDTFDRNEFLSLALMKYRMIYNGLSYKGKLILMFIVILFENSFV